MGLTKPSFKQIKQINNSQSGEESPIDITFTDNLIYINSDKIGNKVEDAGFIFNRGTSGKVALFWDESEDAFRFSKTDVVGTSVTSEVTVTNNESLIVQDITSTGNISVSGNLVVSGTLISQDVVGTPGPQGVPGIDGTTVIAQVLTGAIPKASGTSIIPFDNTVPLSTEGSQLWSRSVTLSNTGNRVKISFTGYVDSGTANRNITVAIFRGTTCIAAQVVNLTNVGRPVDISIDAIDQPGFLGPITYSARIGTSSSATWYINNTSAGYSFNNLSQSYYTIMEIV